MTNAIFTTGLFMECDNFPTNEVFVKISGYYVEPEMGSRDSYGCQIEPDLGVYFELTDIYIQDYDKSVSIDQAATLFERSAKELERYFCTELSEAYENDTEDSIWF